MCSISWEGAKRCRRRVYGRRCGLYDASNQDVPPTSNFLRSYPALTHSIVVVLLLQDLRLINGPEDEGTIVVPLCNISTPKFVD
jgi:hypothetical protein